MRPHSDSDCFMWAEGAEGLDYAGLGFGASLCLGRLTPEVRPALSSVDGDGTW